jgi:hypothetical protein
LISVIPAGDGKMANLFYNDCSKKLFFLKGSLVCTFKHLSHIISTARLTVPFSYLSNMIRTGLPTFRAQTAVTAASGMDRDSLPPKPPPIRFTRTVTLLAGMPRTLATTACMGK